MKQKAGSRRARPRITGQGARIATRCRGEPFILRPIVAAALAGAASIGSLSPAWGAPAGAQVTAGTGSISAVPNAAGGMNTTIRQNGNRLAIDWGSFDIGTHDAVTFVQPNSSAIALNRVTGQSATQVLGSLNANGQVFILNPNGVLFGKSAQVNVGGLLATTSNLSDSDFLAGKFRLTDGGSGSIVNQGRITANDGYIAFIAPRVANRGTLIADRGTVELAAGTAATVTFAGNRLVSLTIDEGTLDALAENGDLIRADGGVVILTSRGRDAVLSGVVNNTGEIRAQTAIDVGGTIKLLAEGGTMLAGGTLDASAPNGGNGGTIETSGRVFQLQPGAVISTHAVSGATGTWLIDPSDITVAATGGSMTGANLSSQLASTNVQLQTSAGSGGSGDITIADTVAWHSGNQLTLTADRDITISAALDAGATGSLVANATRNVSLTGAFTGLSLSATASTGNIALSAPITLDANNGMLTLSSANTITAGQNAAVTTGTFSLTAGAWTQIGNGSLPLFAAANFEVGSNASFLRALSGSGTTAAPYLIGDVYGLQGIGTSVALLGQSYRLANSIDAMGTAAWNGGAGFAPIGSNVESAFSGSFDGNGKTISGLTINAPGVDNVGLFGFILNGSVSSVSLTGASVTGSSFVGSLAGTSQGGTISNVSASNATVRGNATAGGLVGLNGTSGQIDSSWATGTVSGFQTTGGLAGENDGSITRSFSSAAVTAMAGDVGGLAGLNAGTIANSYALGLAATNNGFAGGLVGDNEGAISTSYATGFVHGRDASGGLVAVTGSGVVSNSYWNIDTTGLSTSAGGGTGLTNAQMLTNTASSFAGFDFSNVWRFIPGTSYPYLAAVFPSTPVVFSGTYSKASGAANAAKTLDFAANGQSIGSVTTGANGFYYLMLPSTAFSTTTAVVAFSPSGSGPTLGGSALGAAETAGASVAMDLQDNSVTMAGASVKLGDVASALGNPFSGGAASPVASLLPAVLTNLQSNALATASGVSLVFGPSTVLALTGDTALSAASMMLGPVSGVGATLLLQTSSGDVAQQGAFSLGALGIAGARNVTLTSANAIGTVAANASGSFSLDNAADLTVGTVGSTTGIMAAGPVTLSAAGQRITLAQAMSSSASGDAVVLASSSFTNLYGPGAIAASSGRWLVESASPDSDVFGGLQSGNDALWSQSIGVGASVAAGGNRYVFSGDQVILVNAVANQKRVGETASESATLSLKYAGSAYGNAFNDALVPANVSVNVYSNGDGASATRAGGDDGVGRYRIRYTASGIPAGYSMADGTVADLTVIDPTTPTSAPTLPPFVVSQVQAMSGSDANNDDQHKSKINAVLAALGVGHATRVDDDRTPSTAPAWPVAAACTP
jgi:filamentous hemagglutinin family protein